MEIYVYGTGCGAGELCDSALAPEAVRAFVDGLEAGGEFMGRPVISPEELAGRPYDLVIVTSRHSEAIARRCDGLGIDGGKLLFLKDHMLLTDRNRSYDTARRVLGEDFVRRLQGSQRLIARPLWAGTELLSEEELAGDYVRLKTLEALCRELAPLPGAAAELGVYRGGFARSINRLLPDRRLYLFDSFSGFDPEERPAAGLAAAHERSDAERVLAALPCPERAVLRPGLFPQSAAGLEEERFCLVSLDVDLEQSSYAGLCWFLPRLVPGGCLLLHDALSPRLPGVRAALARYEAEHGRLRRLPLCDVNGTMAILA